MQPPSLLSALIQGANTYNDSTPATSRQFTAKCHTSNANDLILASVLKKMHLIFATILPAEIHIEIVDMWFLLQ